MLLDRIRDSSHAIQPAFGFSNFDGFQQSFQQIMQQLLATPVDVVINGLPNGMNPPAQLPYHPFMFVNDPFVGNPPLNGMTQATATQHVAETELVLQAALVTAPPPVATAFQNILPPPTATGSENILPQPTATTSQNILPPPIIFPPPLTLHILPPPPGAQHLPLNNTVSAADYIFNPATGSWEPNSSHSW